jgi:hypothetical protein
MRAFDLMKAIPGLEQDQQGGLLHGCTLREKVVMIVTLPPQTWPSGED